MAAGGYDGSIKISTKIDQSGFTAGRKQLETQMGGMKKSLTNFAAAVGIAFSAAAIVSFGKKSVQAATEMTNALIGLQSIMEGQGRSFQKAQKFINDYISDGLIPATQAITAYKNLALRGYDDSQIQQVLIALKDSAAFGRQASYSLGEAVQSASEGLKNENSILVDNAGVTKNVAKMWDEYAKSIGTTAASLTQQQKIQAEVNGILEESKYQVGDAAKVANSYSGQILRLSFSFNNLKIAVGNAIIPVVQAVLPAINAIIDALTRAMNVFAQFTSAVFGKSVKSQEKIASTASAGAKAENQLAAATKKTGDATEKAGKQAKGALASFDDLNVLVKSSAADTGAGDAEAMEIPAVDYGSALDIGGEIGEGVTVSPAVQKAVDVLMALLEPLREISFDNLSAAFERLKEAAAPIGRALFAGLEWAYLNLFVPLAKWTIEDLLPAFLDLLSGALNVLSSVIKALMPLGGWLWERFLKPLATWTGGVIVGVLGLIADGLNGLSKWISSNEGIVRNITVVIASFAAAWGLVNLAIGIWNIVGAIATGVTTAFGAAVAFLTSPIGLVVLAVGALIAIIVLLVKQWDETKAAAINVWEKIVEVWIGASDWFSSKVLDPIKKGFKGAINFLIGLAEGFVNGFIKGINAIIRALNTISFENPITGTVYGINIPTVKEINIPRLATGAVIPPNAEFLAVLGDQKSGRNIETPEGLLRQIMQEELAGVSGGGEIVVRFEGTMGQLIRVMKPYIDKEDNRRGKNIISGVATS